MLVAAAAPCVGRDGDGLEVQLRHVRVYVQSEGAGAARLHAATLTPYNVSILSLVTNTITIRTWGLICRARAVRILLRFSSFSKSFSTSSCDTELEAMVSAGMESCL